MTARSIAVLVVALGASGCALHAGARGGAAVSNADGQSDTRGTWSAHVGGSIGAQQGLSWHGAWEIEGHADTEAGSFLTAGASFGLERVPEFERGSLGVLLTVDAGVPWGWDTTLRGAFLGGTFGIPISTSGVRLETDRNRSFQIVGRRMEVVPFLRYRYYRLWEAGPDEAAFSIHDLTGGLLLRARFTTELL